MAVSFVCLTNRAPVVYGKSMLVADRAYGKAAKRSIRSMRKKLTSTLVSETTMKDPGTSISIVSISGRLPLPVRGGGRL